MARVLVCTLEMGTVRGEQRDWALALARDGRHDLVFARGKRLKPTSANRNAVALWVREHPEVDFLLMVDADVVPPVRVLDYVDEDLDVVVFPCHIWRENENADHPVMLNVALEDAPARWVERRQRLVEISRGGTGAMLVARRVLAHPAMRAPFADGFDEDGVRNNGHDLLFCDRARAAGFRVWGAMDCVCSHFKTVDLAKMSVLLRRQRVYGDAFVSPRQAVAGKRLVFCLSPGRCGTGYLARVLGTVPGVVATHEPQPDFADAMRAAQDHPEVAYGFWLERKLPAILTALMQNRTYVETSHLFGQGFVEPLLNLGVVPDAVVLTRPAREVALSYWRRGGVPGRTQQGRTWLLPAPAAPEFTDYQLCYWFVREMERRARRYAGMLRRAGALVYEAALAEVVTREGFEALVGYLQLGEPDRTAYEAANGVVNVTQEERRASLPAGDMAAQETEVRGWMADQ